MIELSKQEVAFLIELLSNLQVSPKQPNSVQILLLTLNLLEKLTDIKLPEEKSE